MFFLVSVSFRFVEKFNENNFFEYYLEHSKYFFSLLLQSFPSFLRWFSGTNPIRRKQTTRVLIRILLNKVQHKITFLTTGVIDEWSVCVMYPIEIIMLSKPQQIPGNDVTPKNRKWKMPKIDIFQWNLKQTHNGIEKMKTPNDSLKTNEKKPNEITWYQRTYPQMEKKWKWRNEQFGRVPFYVIDVIFGFPRVKISKNTF